MVIQVKQEGAWVVKSSCFHWCKQTEKRIGVTKTEKSNALFVKETVC